MRSQSYGRVRHAATSCHHDTVEGEEGRAAPYHVDIDEWTDQLHRAPDCVARRRSHIVVPVGQLPAAVSAERSRYPESPRFEGPSVKAQSVSESAEIRNVTRGPGNSTVATAQLPSPRTERLAEPRGMTFTLSSCSLFFRYILRAGDRMSRTLRRGSPHPQFAVQMSEEEPLQQPGCFLVVDMARRLA